MPRAKAYSLIITCPYTGLCVRGEIGLCDHNPLIEPLFTLFASIPPLSTALSYLDGSPHDLIHPVRRTRILRSSPMGTFGRFPPHRMLAAVKNVVMRFNIVQKLAHRVSDG